MNEKKKAIIEKMSVRTLTDSNKKAMTPEEKMKIIEMLSVTYSYAQISAMTGVPKSTISTWVMRGKESNMPKKTRRMNLQELIDYFENIKPNIDEWGSIEKLRDILNTILESND